MAFQLEFVFARGIDGECAVKGKNEMVMSVFQIRLPRAVFFFELEPVLFGPEGIFVFVKNGEHQRDVVVRIRWVERNGKRQVVGGWLFNGAFAGNEVETLPTVGREVSRQQDIILFSCAA